MTSDRSVIGRILLEARPYRARMLLVFGLGLLATPLALLGPVPLKIAVDSVLGSHPLPDVLQPLVPAWLQTSTSSLLVLAAALQVAVVALTELQGMALAVLVTDTGEKLTLRFRTRLLAHVQRLSFAFHDARGTADSIYRIQYDAPAIQEVALGGLIPVVASGVSLVSMIYVMLRLDVQLALVALAISPLLFWGVGTFRRRTRPKYKHAERLETRALGVVHEMLTAFRVVKAFGREEQESERFIDESSAGVRVRIRLALAENMLGMMVRVITAAGTAVCLWLGVRNVQSGLLTLGELLMLLAYVGRLYEPLREISRNTARMQRRLVSAGRAFQLLDETPDVLERPDARPLRRAEGAVCFRDVSFAYEGHEPALRNLSFEVPQGTRVGIAGPTGAGKTTLVSLLSRFYDPTSGAILLDGVDLRDYRLNDLRSQFAIMLQEPVLFSTTIAENIAYADPSAELPQIEQAARAAGAHDFVSQLSEGYETRVGERGMRLSGGERQRISLARAFLKDAPILILDEPTSSVDLATEAAIMEALDRLMKNRTTFMIAHRTSTLASCNLVLELRDGRLTQIPG
jgi:ATP-binding cassette subfamily B protein